MHDQPPGAGSNNGHDGRNGHRPASGNGQSNTNGHATVASPKAKPARGRAGSRPTLRTLGPVPNLEEHVSSDWWQAIFNSLYLKTDADVVDDDAITRREVDLFVDILQPAQDVRILDLCCGQGRHTLEFARRGFGGVEGFDRSRYLIGKARDRARKEGLPVRFREGDARKLPYPTDSFDVVVILGNSFGYFETKQDDLRVLREVFRVLKPGGRLLVDVTDGDFLRANFEARSWEWIDKKHFVCRERSLSADGDRLISREVITHAEKGVLADQFYAERLYSQEQLRNVMTQAGMQAFETHGALVPASERNQDLGMMAQRIVATAYVRKEWAPVRKKGATDVMHVAVVQGDPSKPDPLKPLAVFDEDDFYVINEMKQALSAVAGYRFTYLDRHDTLVDDLRKLRGKVDFVLNLCDEGFGNDPRKELHVPALLELLDIPYTGGNPQCLAYCYDKSLVRGVAEEMGVPVPQACFIEPNATEFELPFSFPVIVKPNAGDSSFGITQRSVAYNSEELLNAIAEIRDKFGYEKPLLVEEFLTGADLTIGIIGNPPDQYTVLPITEENYDMLNLGDGQPRICGYEAKWLPDSPYWGLESVPADLPEATRQAIEDYSLKLFTRLECRDYARLDWRLSATGEPKLLEVNPNPGWCWDGHLAKMSAHAGVSYSRMLEMILNAAAQRIR